MPLVHDGQPANLTAAQIGLACDASLRRLQTDVIDLYQIHWPNPQRADVRRRLLRSLEGRRIQQRAGAAQGLALVKAGKVRYVGLSNETPWVSANSSASPEAHGLPRIATVQNPYCLINRTLETGPSTRRCTGSGRRCSPTRRWLRPAHRKVRRPGARRRRAPGDLRVDEAAARGRAESREAAPLQRGWRAHGLSADPHGARLVFTKRQTASTIIGVTSRQQLDENLDAWARRWPRSAQGRSTGSAGRPGPGAEASMARRSAQHRQRDPRHAVPCAVAASRSLSTSTTTSSTAARPAARQPACPSTRWSRRPRDAGRARSRSSC